MADLAKLVVRLEAQSSKLTTELERANRKLDTFGRKAKRSLDVFKRAMIGAFSGVAVAGIGRFIVQTGSDFEKLEASLKTVTGSVEEAGAAFGLIKQFAATTPFQLEEVTQAFIKLKSLGLDASVESLRSYGNTAAAMTRPINQFIEAVADASAFQFERLREFGIVAKQATNTVTFTFQGASTTIKKNAEDIEGYLKGIGDVQFASGMSDQMDTLSGKFSNFQDAIAQLAAKLSDSSGLSKALKSITTRLTEMITSITGGPGKIAQLRKELERLQAVGEGRRTRRGRRGGAPPGAISDTVEQINEELIELGGPVGIRLAIQNADDKINEINARLETAGKRVRNKLSQQLRLIKKDKEDLFKELEETELSFNGEGITTPPPSLLPPPSGTVKSNLAKLKKADTEAEREFEKAVRDSEAAVRAENEAYVEWNKSLDDAAQLLREQTNPMEELESDLADIDQLLQQGKISWDTYSEAFFNATENTDARLDKTKATTEEIGKGAIDMGFAFESAFEDAVLGGEAFSDVLNGLLKDIEKVALRQLITAPLGQALSSGISQTYPGFASGGSFTVGGSGGTDSQLVAFRASPGERVDVSKAAGSGTVVNVTNNSGAKTDIKRSNDPSGREVVNIMIGQVARDIASGGAVAQAMQNSFGVRRQGIVRS